MGSLLYALLVVVLFCLSSLVFMKEVTRTVPLVNTSCYSKKALRIEKAYRVFAWGVMTILFFTAVLYSFYEVLVQI